MEHDYDPEDPLYYDETKMDKRGIRAYLSKTKVIEIFEKHIRKLVEKTYAVSDTSNERKSIASFTVGLPKTDLNIDVRFDAYYIDFSESDNTVKLVLRDQQITGRIQLHVDKPAVFLVNFGGDFINKEYIINFLLVIRQLTFTLRVKPQKDGMPLVLVELSVQEMNLSKDLHYYVENSDVLTNVVTMVKGLWMSELEREIMKELVPKVNQEIAKVINEQVRGVYRTQIDIEGDENLRVNLECRQVAVRNEFVVVTLNGFFNNAKKPRKMYSILPQDYALPDISKIIGEDYAVIQVSDDVLHSVVNAYFQNDHVWDQEFTEAGSKRIVIRHGAADHTKIEIHREEDIYGSELFLMLEAVFSVTVHHSILPDVKINAKIRLKASNLKLVEKQEDNESVFMVYRISHIEILEMYDHKMKPLSEVMKKSKMVSVVKEKAMMAVVDRDIKINKIKLGKNAVFEDMNYVVYDDFVTLVGRLSFK